MKWSVKGIELLRSPLGVMVVIPAPHDNDLSKIKPDKEYDVEIKEKRKQRSLTANNYMWLICQKIANVLSKHTYTSKDDVYRKAILDSGAFTYVPIREDAVDRYIQVWQSGGTGWIAEDVGKCQNLDGFHNVKCYHGSSVYTVEEMQRLIDCLVDECSQLGIKLDDSDYIQSLVREWRNEQQKEKG